MDLTPKSDQAIYVASASPHITRFIHNAQPGRPMPTGLSMGDLNFLDPNSTLFNVSHVMSSAGQAMGQNGDCIITKRDRSRTTVIGDSGGFQIIGGVLKWEGDQTREQILRWLEATADWAMTLDVPTRATDNPKSGYKTFRDCLTTTIQNLDYFSRHRNQDAPTKFLNVLQGENTRDANIWFEAVKGYDFEGWAFAGKHRLNLYNLCARVIQMAHENLIQDRDWIHILGTNRITQAIGFTALQRAINRHLNPRLRISYDTSSPFQLTPRWRQIYSIPSFNQQTAVLQSSVAPDDLAYVGSDRRFPWSSPIGDRITCGDICVKNANFQDTSWDELSMAMMVNHNYSVLLLALEQAHRLVDMEAPFAKANLPSLLRQQVDVVNHVIRSGSMAVLKRNRTLLSAYAVKEKPSDDWLNGEDAV